MWRSATLPSTTDNEKTAASAARRRSCCALGLGCREPRCRTVRPAGISPDATIWASVRDTGCSKPELSRCLRISGRRARWEDRPCLGTGNDKDGRAGKSENGSRMDVRRSVLSR